MNALNLMTGTAVAAAGISAFLCWLSDRKSKNRSSMDYGMWIWGGLLIWAITGIGITIAMCEPLVSRSDDGKTIISAGSRGSLFDGIYIALSDLSGLVTAIIATLTGVWGYFFVNRSERDVKCEKSEINFLIDKETLAALFQKLERTTNAEQDGGGQPATRPESK